MKNLGKNVSVSRTPDIHRWSLGTLPSQTNPEAKNAGLILKNAHFDIRILTFSTVFSLEDTGCHLVVSNLQIVGPLNKICHF